MIQLVHSAGQAVAPQGAASPDLSQPPSFAVVDPRRNWYYLVPFGSPAWVTRGSVRAYAGVPVQRSAAEIIRGAQERINASELQRSAQIQPMYVRDDGVLDVDTLRAAAQEIRRSTTDFASRTGTPTGAMNRMIDALNESANAGDLSGQRGMLAWTGLIYVNLLNGTAGINGRTTAQINEWLSNGGISLGPATTTSIQLPAVAQTSALQRTMPRAVNFARRNKTPILVGGVAIAGIIAVAIYMNNKD